MAFLVRQLERLGYHVFSLRCGGALSNCYSKISKKTVFTRKLECLKCRAGGLQSI
jgi:hypothetical protein